ncbi:MAG TPA: nuclear transport factor 2 family protein [Candidatus Acidoferrales bacterium]|jgi:ketosteroid isomerase-like protein|nr:nuclear transport factor 2 family protein [Candidatus Acidoferrales bacterium]
MPTEIEAREFANYWIQAWNSHDLDAVLTHYASGAVLTSPIAAKILNRPSGTVEGKEALRNYFRRGLEAHPNLAFELLDVMYGLSGIVIHYVNQNGTKAGEFMEFDENRQVVRAVANYTA